MPGLKKTSQTNWERVRSEAAANAPIPYDPESDLYDHNDPEQVAIFFSKAKIIRKPGRPKAEAPKQFTGIRLDLDILEAFRFTGKGWQTRINAALREWLNDHQIKQA
jgi:uncharacterized protein (DUF4415 family)